MMDISRFTEEPPTTDHHPERPEREDDDKLPPTPAQTIGCTTTRFLPTIGVWLAGYTRSEPHCWAVADDGQWPGTHVWAGGTVIKEFHHMEEGRHQVWHVLASGLSAEVALERALEKRRNEV